VVRVWSANNNGLLNDPLRYLVAPGADTKTAAKRHNGPVRLSILVPAYNEERTLHRAVNDLLAQPYPVDIEVCVVDDGSTDGTSGILERTRDPRMRVKRHPRNLGKGAALMTAGAMATGTHMVPFDADLEYSTEDLPRMLAPILAGRCEVVFGTRLFGVNTRYQSLQHALGNRALTLATNVLFNAYLSDVHTCLKMMPLPLFRGLGLRETRFGLDAEMTARILQLGIRPFEVSVSYYSRTVADGKKITWRDGVRSLAVLSRVRRGRAAGVEPSWAASSVPASEMSTPDEVEDSARAVVQAP
jgi:glycosyltransferase involved in cell wall biosynthesis